ncbi:hypothetical protein GBA63_22590 (plasmid) [Rubrobacter tropicus]|uniref:Uncharacterized protein n=1 Tax=Rubrobacter tropicus TaxID=2653851 RepID=A0A6G8QG92_9ACTN|nr:protealysin inhibitor emfourin [Rubrobacter tropicus]QIN85490.1 hypothetical protein GBA63_22590 [Rubrobacter tropicus]
MRVTIKTEGGTAHFPGLARPVRIDTEDLPPGEARELEESLRDAGLLGENPNDRRDAGAPARNVRDARRHTITVERDDVRRTTTVSDPVSSPEMSSLISLLERHRRRVLAGLR